MNNNVADHIINHFSNIMIEDKVFIHIHPIFNIPKYKTGWGFDIVGLDEKASSGGNNPFIPHFWEKPNYSGKYVIIDHEKPYDSYAVALDKGIRYYYTFIRP